jgi:heme exporter protein D
MYNVLMWLIQAVAVVTMAIGLIVTIGMMITIIHGIYREMKRRKSK